jgi:hypothetical protein
MSRLAARRGTAAILLPVFLPIAWGSPSALGAASRPAQVHVWLVDLAGVPEKVRTQAEITVMGIFRRAGVELSFVECLSEPARPCLQAPAKADFWLQIMPERPQRLPEDATGFAVLVRSERPGDSYAAVSYPMVESAARDLDASVADVLAGSVAHELGHLLLNSPAHFPNGIMNPRLDRRQIRLLERGALLFTREQAVRLAARARQLAR